MMPKMLLILTLTLQAKQLMANLSPKTAKTLYLTSQVKSQAMAGQTGKASTAEANAGGYKIDSNSTGKSIVIKDAEVTGGFYGPNATEMGGSFAHKNSGDDGKVSVVFGTKKQQEVK